MILQNFLFLKEQTGVQESNELWNGNSTDGEVIATSGTTLTLQVDAITGTPVVEVYGKVNDESATWYKVSVINTAGLAVADACGAGIWTTSIEGMKKIKIKQTAAGAKVTVFGTISAQ